jgi:hypothetical protein
MPEKASALATASRNRRGFTILLFAAVAVLVLSTSVPLPHRLLLRVPVYQQPISQSLARNSSIENGVLVTQLNQRALKRFTASAVNALNTGLAVALAPNGISGSHDDAGAPDLSSNAFLLEDLRVGSALSVRDAWSGGGVWGAYNESAVAPPCFVPSQQAWGTWSPHPRLVPPLHPDEPPLAVFQSVHVGRECAGSRVRDGDVVIVTHLSADRLQLLRRLLRRWRGCVSVAMMVRSPVALW